ncbi:MAG: aminoglycoside phosphotransferase family protein, partial [Oscillospiraceae bacterium]|nr:aminoglycoside phosphotransferase family protein [Oscillospiraceae bacterium]
ENVCTTPLTERQQKEIAEIVGTLHNCVEDMPFDFTNITEDFTIPCKELMKVPGVSSGDFCVYNERDMIMRAIEKAHTLADKVKSNDPYFALCHTDIHGWNLMQSDQLILIDWESIKFAPVEADLYTFWNDWYWGDSNWGSYWNTFLPIYSNICTDYVVNKENLLFYQMRRHIEDIEEFYKQYLYEEMTNETRREVISCLERECRFLSTLIH